MVKSRRRKSRNCPHGKLKNRVKLSSGRYRYCKLAQSRRRKSQKRKSRRRKSQKRKSRRRKSRKRKSRRRKSRRRKSRRRKSRRRKSRRRKSRRRKSQKRKSQKRKSRRRKSRRRKSGQFMPNRSFPYKNFKNDVSSMFGTGEDEEFERLVANCIIASEIPSQGCGASLRWNRHYLSFIISKYSPRLTPQLKKLLERSGVLESRPPQLSPRLTPPHISIEDKSRQLKKLLERSGVLELESPPPQSPPEYRGRSRIRRLLGRLGSPRRVNIESPPIAQTQNREARWGPHNSRRLFSTAVLGTPIGRSRSLTTVADTPRRLFSTRSPLGLKQLIDKPAK